MPVESATYISQLDVTKPAGSDPKAEGDDHVRLLKASLKATFPNFTAAALNATQAQLDKLVTSLAVNASAPANAIFVDATGNVMVGSTVPGLQAPGRGYLEIAGSSTAMTAYRSAGNMTGYTSGFTTGLEIYGVTDVVVTAGVNTCQRMNNTGAVFFPSISTTAAAANAFLNSGSSPANQLLRSTSSIRYKRDVEDLDQALAQAAVDGLRPIWYRSNAEADNKAWSWYGLLAEEVAQIEPRLVHWGYTEEAYEEVDVPYQELVNRDTGLRHADGSPVTIEEEVTKYRKERRLKAGAELVPDGVQYERLSVLLLAVVKRCQSEIADLRSRVTALEAE